MSDKHPAAWGDANVGTAGVCAISLYLTAVFLFLLFSLARAWPPIDLCNEGVPAVVVHDPAKDERNPDAGGIDAANNSGADKDAKKADDAAKKTLDKPDPGKGAKTDAKQAVPDRTLLCLVAIVGALGAIIHAMRSLYAFVGNGQLKYCWLPMYILLPCIGSALALIFFLILKGILSSGAGTGATYNTTLGYLAVAGIVGLFTEETVVKIQEIAQTILGKKQDQKDPLDPTPAATQPVQSADGQAG